MYYGNKEREIRNAALRELWATGQWSIKELAFFWDMKHQRVFQICKGTKRNMTRVCRICETTFTARHPKQKTCAKPPCLERWIQRRKNAWARKQRRKENRELEKDKLRRLKPMRDYGGKAAIMAKCFDCDKMWESANAHGVAAQHARKYGHHTSVEVTFVYHYNAPERKKDGRR
jgi:hypothetical protein